MFRNGKVILLVALLLVLCAGACGGGGGCSVVDHPAIASDGAGGAIVAYSVSKGVAEMGFYLRKMDAEGNKVWHPGDVHLGNGHKDESGEIRLVTDDQENSSVSWYTNPSGHRFVPILTKVDSSGSILWEKDVRYIHDMVSDGAGGILFATSAWAVDGSQEGAASVVRVAIPKATSPGVRGESQCRSAGISVERMR